MEQMKRCWSCDETKPLSSFSLNKAKRDGRQTACRPCKSDIDKRNYASSSSIRQTIKASNSRRRAERRKFINDYLRCHPCVDCREDDIVVLDFDHVRGEKVGSVTVMAIKRLVSMETLLAEIEKCDVRCANCHRRRHARVAQ